MSTATQAPTTTRDDFFTLIHKGLRQALFSATTHAGALDWGDRTAVDGFAAQWAELHHLLQIHTLHEDEHFFPILDERAPAAIGGVHAAHDALETELAHLDTLIAARIATPSDRGGLEVYRALSGFVARYLLHLLDEETFVMPAIWEHCSDEELARIRAAFLASMAPEDATLSRLVMIPAMSPNERLLLLTTVRDTAPPSAFDAVIAQTRALLDLDDWRRLEQRLQSADPVDQRDKK